MTREYAARRLLEHGPLTHAQLVQITGWPAKSVSCVMRKLRYAGHARRGRNRREFTEWRLA